MAEKKKEKETKEAEKAEVKKEAPKEEKKEEPVATPAPTAPVEAPKHVPKKMRLAIVHVYSSKNDTIITATDMSGAETLAWASGGMMVKSHREEGRPYAAMQATAKVVSNLKEKGITHVHVKIRAPGGNGSKTPGQGAQAVVRTLARTGLRIGKIEDVTPLPTDSMRRKGGRRGRRV
ncbi:30S ribosomal protein S11 [Candidatus Micrarchaeota archaeon]|nr:30S ribosomal protein S11 [Candidatus Micrarchaeota archaeon]